MHRFRLLFVVCVFGMLAGCTAASTTAPPAQAARDTHVTTAPVPEVILISIDGYRAGYLNRGDNPVLERLAAQGVRARWMIPSFPTVTEPNHYTLLTGRYPNRNGIVANTIADRRVQREHFHMSRPGSLENPSWWSQATPLWVTAQRAGMRTAEMSWPSGYVYIDGMRPDLHRNGKHAGGVARETSTVIQWLELPSDRRPRFIMLHYEPVDADGHRYGPDSPQVDHALREVDHAIGRLVSALKRDHLYASTDLVVVSDHGMAAIPPDHEIYLDDLVDTDAIHVVTGGAFSGINPRDSRAGRQAERKLLGTHQHMQCWKKHDLPPHLHYGSNPRIPAVVCIASPGWWITTHARQARRKFPLRGDHGYDNRVASMRAFFIAEGPSFRNGYVAPPFPNVDVYSLLAHILHLVPEKNDGDFARVEPMLRVAQR